MDQSKKTMRHFYCRDVLWETFEQMANDFDCSIDYLVNESMRYYARSKNYGGGDAKPPVTGGQREREPKLTGQNVPVRSQPITQQPPTGAGGSPARKPPGPTPGFVGSQPPRPVPTPSVPPAASGPTLFLIYNGQRYSVAKDQFIIGQQVV
jgi:neural Wiskott-Aldrich syndrome protein